LPDDIQAKRLKLYKSIFYKIRDAEKKLDCPGIGFKMHQILLEFNSVLQL
jgi:hypothetical protein